MTDNKKVSIIIQANDQASKVFKDMKRGSDDFTKTATKGFDSLKVSALNLQNVFTGLVGVFALSKLKAAISGWVHLAGIQQEAEAGLL